jgi:hypothetical protein
MNAVLHGHRTLEVRAVPSINKTAFLTVAASLAWFDGWLCSPTLVTRKRKSKKT